MTDYALTSLTPAAPQIAPHAGLLYAPGTDWATWAMIAIVAVALWCLMPGQVKASAKALWAPVGRFLRSLCCPWLWEGCFLWTVLCGALVEAVEGVVNIFTAWGREQLVLEGYPGYLSPVTT